MLWLLLGAVALVFVIAATNVANLFLVRAEVRRRETGIRAALGAGRRQLALHYVSESLLVVLMAAALGVFIAHVGVQSLTALAPASVPRVDEVHVGLRPVAIALALAVTCGVSSASSHSPTIRGAHSHCAIVRVGLLCRARVRACAARWL